MNLMPAKLGAEKKKIGILAGLLLIAGYFYFSGNSSNAPAPARLGGAAPDSLQTTARAIGRVGSRDLTRGAGSGPREFRPSFKTKGVDPSHVDPTLHLSALAKLNDVAVEAGTRSLFDVGPEPPPAKIDVQEPAKILVARKMVGPMLPPSKEASEKATPVEPKAPPIPLKFYGFVNPPKAGIKRAFFLDGEDIVIAGEGDLIKKRYKIVRIGVNSAVVEDTEFKSNNEQTLPLVAELAG